MVEGFCKLLRGGDGCENGLEIGGDICIRRKWMCAEGE